MEKPNKHLKIFIIESPNPNDYLSSVNERSSLESMCKMFDYQSASFTTYSKFDFIKIIKYISNISLEKEDTLCLHFSCHGNNEGIAIGPDFINWNEFIDVLTPILENNIIGDKSFIIISACGANAQKITKIINSFSAEKKTGLCPPSYFFVYNQEKVVWSDSLLCWAILYHQLSKVRDFSKKSVQDILTRIKYSELGDIKYYRWENRRMQYLNFVPLNK